jgi:hypothetical protein
VPTVARWQGYRFFCYNHEPNEPPHIHVDARGCTAKLWLRPTALARNVGFGARELATLIVQVRERSDALLEAWHRYFGTERR